MKKQTSTIIINTTVILLVAFGAYQIYDFVKFKNKLAQESQTVKEYKKSVGERIEKLKERQAEAEQRIKELSKKD